MDNPFSTHLYHGPEYFCDRNSELSTLLEMFDNGRFGLLYSMRRLGKTGMIHHFHQALDRRNGVVTVYCDIQNTRTDSEFASKLIEATVAAIETTQQGVLKRINSFFASLRPVFSFDPITNSPSIQLSIDSPKETQMSLRILMEMLGQIPFKVQIALDEFQQIAAYDTTEIDATLRGFTHLAPNVHMVFSGSQQHLLLGLFSDARRPFFGTVDHLRLGPIEMQVYGSFIFDKFTERGQNIAHEAITEILDWTRRHTFYTQYMCNRIFAKHHAHVSLAEVELEKRDILFSFEPAFLNLRSVMSPNQFKLIKGIAKEGIAKNITSSAFLGTYELAQSTAQQALKVLLDKELLYQEQSTSGSSYFVYDPFFSRWLETQ